MHAPTKTVPFAAAVALLALLSALVLWPLASARAQTVPTLTGQTLGYASPGGSISGDCDPGGVSTITYAVSGTASGPYPGTFTETGTVTIGPQTEGGGTATLNRGQLLTWEASFTIHSGDTTVTGTKSGGQGYGMCQEDVLQASYNLYWRNVVEATCSSIRYEATISGPGGASVVGGLSGATVFDHDYTYDGAALAHESFNETYADSTPTEASTTTPTATSTATTTATPTATGTDTPQPTETGTATPTAAAEPSDTATPSPTGTFTATPADTASPTATASTTRTAAATLTATPTRTATATATRSAVGPPTNADQCRDGGWRAYGFKNQGACASSVSGKGKKPPKAS